MKDYIKQVIRDNAHLIDDNNFDEFYKKICQRTMMYSDICDVTEFLLDVCSVDPMPYLTTIPKGYLFKSQRIKDINLFENIEAVEQAAYLGSSVKRVTLPKSCTQVYPQAFSGCTQLTELRIENPDILMDSSAFTQTHDCCWIMYNGSQEKFVSKQWPDELVEDSYVICTDGTLHMIKGVAKK
jgi:hypothetical protein